MFEEEDSFRKEDIVLSNLFLFQPVFGLVPDSLVDHFQACLDCNGLG